MRPLTLLLFLAACPAADSDTSAADSAAGTADASPTCTDLCTASGYDGGSAVEYDHELNCTCAGGDGTGEVAEADCAAACVDLGWASGSVYASTGGANNACQCSE